MTNIIIKINTNTVAQSVLPDTGGTCIDVMIKSSQYERLFL